MSDSQILGTFLFGLIVFLFGTALVMAALWAVWGWAAAVGFVGTIVMITGIAIWRVRG